MYPALSVSCTADFLVGQEGVHGMAKMKRLEEEEAKLLRKSAARSARG